jgi:hypothetical protein
MALNTRIRGAQINLADETLVVADDSFAFYDATDGVIKRDAIADVVSAIAGSGLGASAGVMSVDVDDVTIEIATGGLQIMADSIDDSHFNAGVGTAGQVLKKGTGNVIYWDDESAVSEDYIQEAEIITENVSAQIAVTGFAGDFDITYAPVLGSVQVFLNGLLQEEGTGKDYTINGTGNKVISFTTDPIAGDIVIVHYVRT